MGDREELLRLAYLKLMDAAELLQNMPIRTMLKSPRD